MYESNNPGCGMIVLRPEDQEISVAAARRHIAEGIRRILVQAPCGYGKCLAKGTPVLMFDGSIKNVEDVCVGDFLMGPDSQPRRVESLARGQEMMYRIVPKHGNPYVVNESHVLSLLHVESDLKKAITVRDYLRWGDEKNSYTGWRVPGVLSGNVAAVRCQILDVEPVGIDDYYGFEISGPDRLFLLGDFTVTHNTVVCAYIAKSAAQKGKNVLILVHREELASQASRTLTRFGVEHGFIMAGITTDPTKRVFIGMIDTVRNRVKAGKIPKKFDIVMPDECHHSVSPSWQFVLDHFHENNAVIVGFSATPERLSGEPLGDVFDVMVPGPQVRELIDRGSLADYVYFAPPTMLDVSAIKKSYGDYSTSDLAKATDKPQITGDAIDHYKRLLYGKRAIVFAVNIMHSLHIVEQFNAAGIPAAHVDGDTPKGERKSKMQAFERGELWVLSNVGLFGEGVDVKACEGVILLRATASLSLFIQMSMRPMRPHESKEKAFIIDHVGNVLRHGLPDAYREWSLEGRPKKIGKKKEEPDVNVKQCPNCFVCHDPAPQCPSCGHIYRVERKLEQVDGELQEITADMREQMRKDQMRQQGKASTIDELVELGHSRFRAEKILQARQEKQQIIAELIADLTAWQEETNLMPFTIFGVSYRDIRFMKPKQLRELRARFELHKAEHLAASQTGELLEYAL